ncbi:hypothetical protein DRQ09_00745 [candidate division KSB1 bacterium]|nr:MAG: hypothetical protein DRQ09_00745 [candidate division KSB1 bacterium]
MRSRIIKILLLLVIFSCGGGNVLPPEEKAALEESAEKLTIDGWKYYEEGKYSEALTKFIEASKRKPVFLDSFNGLGWTYFALHILNYSVSNFSFAVSSDSTFEDALIGLSLASFEINDYQESINSIKKAVELDSLGFVFNGSYKFIHNEKVNARSVRKIMALSYYYLGNFIESYNQLKTYLKPQVSLDINSPDFPRLLLIELEEL